MNQVALYQESAGVVAVPDTNDVYNSWPRIRSKGTTGM